MEESPHRPRCGDWLEVSEGIDSDESPRLSRRSDGRNDQIWVSLTNMLASVNFLPGYGYGEILFPEYFHYLRKELGLSP